jgi:hypothetical protein
MAKYMYPDIQGCKRSDFQAALDTNTVRGAESKGVQPYPKSTLIITNTSRVLGTPYIAGILVS